MSSRHISSPPLGPALGQVPKSALWTLHHRCARLHDPMAERLLAQCEPLDAGLGRRTALMADYFLERVMLFDGEVRRFLARHPGGTVVSLGEGLETQFWRVDNGRVRWLTVDLPQMVALRRQLLPHGERQRTHPGSALDDRWMHGVDTSSGVLILAQGLFMYLRPREAFGLIRACSRRFPGGALVFDTPPPWFALMTRLRLARCGSFRIPRMRFSMSSAGLRRLRPVRRHVTDVRALVSATPPGAWRRAVRRWPMLPLGRTIGVTVRVDFPTAPRETV
ncbi:class I SAM-dependent methyltransferase [Streptomyces sp. TS71-3]|uniref:class I SAM-dependent methyltransferase n=1 Tax=Streptomyces sp. TS71-3 TaxID=2733862 RepID=UPI001B172245|nr:class I SAM-dependent methyltransferase [Streptomyces sp. TS71-3]GHJ35665.1 O-methyltransferase [Streptomyces sp. TS71-3]